MTDKIKIALCAFLVCIAAFPLIAVTVTCYVETEDIPVVHQSTFCPESPATCDGTCVWQVYTVSVCSGPEVEDPLACHACYDVDVQVRKLKKYGDCVIIEVCDCIEDPTQEVEIFGPGSDTYEDVDCEECPERVG